MKSIVLSATLAAAMLVSTFWVLAQKANRPIGQAAVSKQQTRTNHPA
jgi:hypothetical protein